MKRQAIGPLDWETALFGLLHPSQVAIVEALYRIEEPLSPVLMVEVMDGRESLNNLAYHVRRLQDRGVIEEVGYRPARGAVEHLYALRGTVSASLRTLPA